MILLDTSVVIELLERRSGAPAVLAHLERFGEAEIHLSAITMFEVEVGLFDGSPNIRARRARWRRIVGLSTYELVTDGIAYEAARIVRTTAKRGHQLGAMDALIAATAMEFDLTLATRDRDFERVPSLKHEFWT